MTKFILIILLFGTAGAEIEKITFNDRASCEAAQQDVATKVRLAQADWFIASTCSAQESTLAEKAKKIWDK